MNDYSRVFQKFMEMKKGKFILVKILYNANKSNVFPAYRFSANAFEMYAIRDCLKSLWKCTLSANCS